MRDSRDIFSLVGKVNLQFGGALVLGFLAWLAWPSESGHWAFFYVSFLLAGAAVSGIINGTRLLLEFRGKRRRLAGYRQKGEAPKADQLATDDARRRAGMVD